MDKRISIVTTDDFGRDVVAATTFKEGDLVFTESALFSSQFSSVEAANSHIELGKAWVRLANSDRPRSALELYFANDIEDYLIPARKVLTSFPDSDVSESELAQIIAICDSNHHRISGGAGLFQLASMLNHSCVPNCQFSTVDDRLTVRVICNVDAGTSLCICYIDPYETTAMRRKQLLHQWNFYCRCARCITLPDLCRVFVCPRCHDAVLEGGKNIFTCQSCSNVLNDDELERALHEEKLADSFSSDVRLMQSRAVLHNRHARVFHAMLRALPTVSDQIQCDYVHSLTEAAVCALQPKCGFVGELWMQAGQIYTRCFRAKEAAQAFESAVRIFMVCEGENGPHTLECVRLLNSTGVEQAALQPLNVKSSQVHQPMVQPMATDVSGCAVNGCGKSGLLRCAACKQTRYCSAQCQRQHWSVHKLNCAKRGPR